MPMDHAQLALGDRGQEDPYLQHDSKVTLGIAGSSF